MEKYRVISGNNLVLRTDSFEEAYAKYKEIIERSIGSDWLEEAYKVTYIEKLKKGTHTYIPV